MLNLLRKIIKPQYETLNRLEIKADNIIANYEYLAGRQPGVEIFPVLKSNAYGHGLKEMCQILNRTKAPLVIVDSFPEAQIVYRYFRGPVLILGEMPLKAYDYCRLEKTEFVVYNEETLKYLARFGKRARIHLFLNSGMNREGIQDMTSFIVSNKSYLDKVTISGLASHLASAESESELNAVQEDRFLKGLEILKEQGFSPRWVHLGNSAYLLKEGPKSPLINAYRPGLALYGYSPLPGQGGEETALKPALEAFSQVVAVQALDAGASVSYNETYQASQPSRVAVIPFGYFEGLDRRLSNRGQFLVDGQEKSFWAPIAGAVCMNLTCLDIGQEKVGRGDQVKVISAQAEDSNSVVELAALLETIPYEILVKIQVNIRRIIV